ncbi:uncharacterized protein LOC113204887 [Frankliniella occidentalis]|uniref:Uncharacterized protein LOC113204887 n=1 Tax=Frankliniella occidentalis TaxID=133901 RepID=A0A6J1S4V3_FRAOC|nr:uncharacterized protein LOC113204887 [Frankliniella occidentalis]
MASDSVLQLLVVVTVVLLTGRAGVSSSSPPPARYNATALARAKRVAVYDVPDEDKHDALLVAALQRASARPGPAWTQPPMHKATLTQMGYIQFLRYIVDVPELRELSFCVWLRSRNLTHNHPILSYSKHERDRLARAWVSPAVGHRLPPRLHFVILERPVLVEPLPEAAQRRWVHICASWDGRSGLYRLYVDGRTRRAGVRPEVTGLVLPGGGDVVVGQEYTDFDKGLDDGVEGEVFGFHLFRTAAARAPAPPELEHDEDLQHQLLSTRRRGDTGAPRSRRRSSDSASPPRRRTGASEEAVASSRRSRSPRWRFGPPSAPSRVQRLHACERLAPEDRAEAIVSWPSTPVRVFGGAIISHVKGGCGDF